MIRLMIRCRTPNALDAYCFAPFSHSSRSTIGLLTFHSTPAFRSCGRVALTRAIDYNLGVLWQATFFVALYEDSVPPYDYFSQQLHLYLISRLALLSKHLSNRHSISTPPSTNPIYQLAWARRSRNTLHTKQNTTYKHYQKSSVSQKFVYPPTRMLSD